MPTALMPEHCRAQFPALRRTHEGRPLVFFDGPAGSQVPQRVIDAVSQYFSNRNANHEGVFVTSRESDQILDEAHRAVADFLGSAESDLVAFGPNMTTLTFALSRALARTWQPGDEVVVTHLDHDANVTPWVLAARDAGATVRHVGLRRTDCTLDLEDFDSKLTDRTRLVALTCASNAVGTVPPVKDLCARAHAAGARVFLDAVHLAPHRPIDVTAWDCDFLVCSAYKFFGPHVGVLWGKRSHLEELPAYKVRPAPKSLPGRWMTGTQSHEGIAGTLEAVEYIANLGRVALGLPNTAAAPPRRQALLAAYGVLREHEEALALRFLEGVAGLDDVKVWGITDSERLAERVPTFSLTHSHVKPQAIAEHLASRGICAWHGNFYAQPLTEALELEPDGLVRVGFLHYNMAGEVDRLLSALAEL